MCVLSRTKSGPDGWRQVTVLRRQDVVEWIRKTYPGDDTGLLDKGAAFAPAPGAGVAETKSDPLLKEADVIKHLGISRATLSRRRTSGEFPPPDATSPNRWRLSTVERQLARSNPETEI